MKSSRLILLVVCLLAAALLAACGDSSDADQPTATGSGPSAGPTTDAEGPSGEADASGGEDTDAAPGLSDSKQVSLAIEALLIDPDNDLVCDQVLSEKLLRSAYGDRQGCRNQRRPQLLSESTKINGLEVDGDTATAVAIPKGGLYDGEKLEIVAVREGDTWQIEQFIADIPVGP